MMTLAQQRETLVEYAAMLDPPFPRVVVRGTSWQGEPAWRNLCRTLQLGEVPEVERQLGPIEDEMAKCAEREREEEAREAARSLPDPMQRVYDDMTREAVRLAEYAASPAGQRARLIKALEQNTEALKQKR